MRVETLPLLPVFRQLSAALAVGVALAACQSVTPSAAYPLETRGAWMHMAHEGGSLAEDAATTELRQVFAAWAEARSSGDATRLEGLYDVRHFEGVRWTRTGVEKRLTWAEWSGDLRPELGLGKTPEQPVFETWPGGTLDAATASVTFVDGGAQRRVLVFGRAADGKLRVVREELGSRPGDGHAGVVPGNALSRDAKVLRALGETADK
jgi:hypothetical protein